MPDRKSPRKKGSSETPVAEWKARGTFIVASVIAVLLSAWLTFWLPEFDIGFDLAIALPAAAAAVVASWTAQNLNVWVAAVYGFCVPAIANALALFLTVMSGVQSPSVPGRWSLTVACVLGALSALTGAAVWRGVRREYNSRWWNPEAAFAQFSKPDKWTALFTLLGSIISAFLGK